MRSLALLLLALFTGPAEPETAVTRDVIEDMHAAMIARLRRDPAGVSTFYAPTAAVIESGRRHVGGAAVYAFWSQTPSSTTWTQNIFEIGGSREAPWVAGRSLMVYPGGASKETFFIRVLKRDGSGALRIHSEALSSKRGTGTPAEVEAATRGWLQAVRTKNVAALERVLDDGCLSIASGEVLSKAAFIAGLERAPASLGEAWIEEPRPRIFGALAVATGVLRAADGGARDLTSIWMQTEHGWRMAAVQLQ